MEPLEGVAVVVTRQGAGGLEARPVPEVMGDLVRATVPDIREAGMIDLGIDIDVSAQQVERVGNLEFLEKAIVDKPEQPYLPFDVQAVLHERHIAADTRLCTEPAPTDTDPRLSVGIEIGR